MIYHFKLSTKLALEWPKLTKRLSDGSEIQSHSQELIVVSFVEPYFFSLYQNAFATLWDLLLTLS